MNLFVAAIGMTCPVGYLAATACAAMRCQLNRRRELTYHDRTGEPIVGSAMHDWFEVGTARSERIAVLAARAIEDALRGLGERGETDRALERHPLILALASTLGDRERAALTQRVCALLEARLGVRVDPRRVGVIADDAAGAYRGLAWAAELFASAQAEACIVCAADSLISARELLRLERAQRLVCALDSDGLIPGEAAACVVVQPRRDRPLGPARGQVLGLGFAREASSLTNDVPLRADGLVAATRAALDQAGRELHEVDLRMSDLTGESFFFKEQTLLLTRVMTTPRPELPLWACATTLGHTGAAAGMCNLVWAHAANARGYAPGPLVFACAGSDDGLRGALVLSLSPREPSRT
ncbi:3-oxoacyl-(acyl carrier protein) synthase [Enhygromyxa salina]|uniref:3-oxoacyl-(Acyl carrier protein) synthase n=1 Tax=Enhygromyxa salina TaxID=215803 RepID=A0A2S9XRA7_9BACT|nr:hypothetical protein [Enhygromyxa salina]PRP95386.1 3-oxoacyl-(acyl carrier protein) synthase [Enhygromyxa salina]